MVRGMGYWVWGRYPITPHPLPFTHYHRLRPPRCALPITLLAAALVFLFALSACDKPQRQWVPDWKETSTLGIARAGSAVVVLNDTIFMIGGVDGRNFLDTTEYAKIHKDGSLGPWQPGPGMNEARGFVDAVAHNGFVYVVGGGNGPYGENFLRSAERARILPDGTLGAWEKEKNEMVLPRRCVKIIATDKALYSFGGFAGALLDSVELAEFLPDGSLGEWRLEPETMTIPRYVNGVKQWGNSAYVIGGHDQTRGVGITGVEWSPLGGGNRDWKPTSPLQTGRYGLATASHGDYLYALGGLSGAEYLDSVEKSKVGGHGELAPWQTTTALSQARATFSVATYRDWIYVIGGTNRDGYLNTVEYATVNRDGDIGYWGRQGDVEAHKARLAALQRQKSQLPNAGVVISVVQTEGYTYLEVITPAKEIVWIAGPKLIIEPDASVRYSKGVAMTNFYSNELKRNFEQVLFAGQVEKAQ